MARRIGRDSKRLRATADLRPVASVDTVVVYRRPAHDPATPWRNYYARDMSPDRRAKRAYHVAYNGERFAESHDIATLREKRPELLAALSEVIAADHATG